MRAHLIRHADARPRRSWSEPDAQRPLSDLGAWQATALADLAEDLTPACTIHSSPAVRCTETVAPLARKLGTEVRLDHRLAEGADPHAVVTWLTDLAEATDVVLCGHGDLLPEVLRLLAGRGMTLDGPNACQKGSVWTCVIDGGPRHATYRPPPHP